MKLKLLSGFICFFLLSCINSQRESKEEQKTFTQIINVDLGKSSVGLTSSFFSEAKVIPLETKNDFLIGKIGKIIEHNSDFFVFDIDMLAVIVFDSTGMFKHKISNVGHGPKEYYRLENIYIDKNKNWLILDNYEKFQVYNAANFEFIAEFPFAIKGAEKYYLGDNYFVNYRFYSDYLTKNHISIEFDSKLTDSYFPITEKMTNIDFQPEWKLFKGDSCVYYIPSFENVIYKITAKGENLAYRIDFGENALPENFIDNIESKDRSNKLRQSDYCYFIQNFIQNKSLMSFRFLYDNKFYFYVNSLKRGKVFIGKDVLDDITLNPYVFINLSISEDENYLISYSNVDEYQENFEQMIYAFENESSILENLSPEDKEKTTKSFNDLRMVRSSTYYKELEDLNKLAFDSNPIIFKMKLRD